MCAKKSAAYPGGGWIGRLRHGAKRQRRQALPSAARRVVRYINLPMGVALPHRHNVEPRGLLTARRAKQVSRANERNEVKRPARRLRKKLGGRARRRRISANRRRPGRVGEESDGRSVRPSTRGAPSVSIVHARVKQRLGERYRAERAHGDANLVVGRLARHDVLLGEQRARWTFARRSSGPCEWHD